MKTSIRYIALLLFVAAPALAQYRPDPVRSGNFLGRSSRLVEEPKPIPPAALTRPSNPPAENIPVLTIGARTFTNCTLEIWSDKEAVLLFTNGVRQVKIAELPEPWRSKYSNFDSAAPPARPPLPESVIAEFAANASKIARLRKQIVDDSAPFVAQAAVINAQIAAKKLDRLGGGGGSSGGTAGLFQCQNALTDIRRRIEPLIAEVELRDLELRKIWKLPPPGQ